MAKTHITNRETLKPKLFGLSALALSLAAAFGVYQVSSCIKSSFEDGNKRDAVESAIEDKNFGVADALLEDFQGTPEDKTELEVILRQSKQIDKFDYAIGEFDETSANDIISQMRSSGEYSLSIIAEFETKVHDITEAGLYGFIDETNGQDLPGLCQSYLERFADGEHVDSVVNKLVEYSISEIDRRVKNKLCVKSTNILLSDLLNVLESYKDVALSTHGAEIFSEERIEEYLVDVKLTEDEAEDYEFKVGDTVTYIESDDGSWNSSFLSERNKMISIGSSGEVIGIRGDYFIVEMDGDKSYPWIDNSSYAEGFYRDDKLNATAFFDDELKLGRNTLEYDAVTIKASAQKIRALLSK